MYDVNQICNEILSIMPQDQYDCGNNNQMSLYSEVSLSMYAKLTSELLSYGFCHIQNNSLDYLRSTTLYSANGNYNLILVFDEISSELRIIKDSYSSSLRTIPEEAGNTAIRLWQFEIDHSLIDCGMCYIIQCSDYSFFIVDSAHTYSVNDDIRIFNFLRSKTPESLPVIVSGWFLTHGHVDHIAKFLDILKYNNEIIIKGIYYNFVPTDHFSSDCWMHSDKNHTELFNKIVSEHSEIPVYKLHSGQYFYIDGIRFDVMCSHEDVFPIDLENYNDSSTCLMMTYKNDKVCFPGDAGGAESIIMERRFPDFLKCDIMQVAHHGHFGTSVEFYKMSSPKVALFATTQIKFDEELPHYEANRVVCEISKHCFIASNGTVEFSFPLKDSVIKIYPDEIIENFDGVYKLWGYEYSDERKQELIEFYINNKKFKEINY